ncbi:PQQ-binding-like beta-propeller repeat protein [Brevibacillus laterosporus]|uniref:PQQ-binding-like beta-propeller repeat protein n=1 Tax=Brevibacillus laterosporus TaxID=1465 RepID=UPI0035A61C4A
MGTYELGNRFNSSLVVGSDGTIYAGENDGYLYAIKPDGTHKWAFKIKGDFSSAPVIGKGGGDLLSHPENKLYAVNPNGTKKWGISIGKNQLSSEISIGADGTLYLCENDEPNSTSSEKSYLYAINPNGKIK